MKYVKAGSWVSICLKLSRRKWWLQVGGRMFGNIRWAMWPLDLLFKVADYTKFILFGTMEWKFFKICMVSDKKNAILQECLNGVKFDHLNCKTPPPPSLSEAEIFDWRLFLRLYRSNIVFQEPFIIHLSGILLVNHDIYEIFINIFQSFLFFFFGHCW